MVALKPDFEKVVELAIFSNVLWREMAMIGKYWLVLRELVIEASGGAGAEQEIIVNEFHVRMI